MPVPRAFGPVTLAIALAAQPWTLRAYQQTLDAAALHEAYVLGQRNDAATAAFRATYLKEFTTDSRGNVPVTQIEVLTPFVQVVDRSRRNTAGYSEQQARIDYEKYPNTVVFNITLMLPAAYQAAKQNPSAASENPQNPTQGPEDFWRRFEFRVKQDQKLLPISSVRSQPIYSTSTPTQPAVLDGANVWLDLEVKDVASTATLVEVRTPDGNTISANFDLKRLR
jgi:hypothetical protein